MPSTKGRSDCMTEDDLRIHNIALLYEIIMALHPDEAIDPCAIAANYEGTVRHLKESFK